MKQRIVAIDILRGFALLGILLMNMSSYAMPGMAYFNPTVYGGDELWNRLIFSLNPIFADQKMMALFSMLFGASVLLVTNNMEKKGESSLWFYYSRNAWLLVFGLIHSILFWEGDVLVIYALCSFILYWLRRMLPKCQLGLGLFIFFIPSLFHVWISGALPDLQSADWQYLESFWQPSEAAIATEIALYQGNYTDHLSHRLSDGSIGQSLIATFLFYGFGLSLFGMVDRIQQILIILFIWGIQIAFSSWWLGRFQYGPLEWIWRCLSHGRWQPLQKKQAVQIHSN